MTNKLLFLICFCAFSFTFVFGQNAVKDEPVLKRRPPAREEFERIDKALAIEPENQELYIKKAALYCSSNDEDAALLNIETVIHIDSNNEFILHKAAEQLFYCGLYEESIKIADALILKNPKGVTGYRIRFSNRYALEDYRGAIEDFIKGRGGFENEILREKRWLKTLDKLKDDENIFRYYDELFKLMEKSPKFGSTSTFTKYYLKRVDLLGSAAKIYFLRGRIKESEDFFKRMIEVYPTENTYEKRAKIYAEIEKFPEAFADINGAIAQTDEKQRNLLNENEVLAKSDEDTKIKENLRYIRILDEIKAEFYITRGDIYILKKDFDKAISDYQTATSLNPQNERRVKEKIDSIRRR